MKQTQRTVGGKKKKAEEILVFPLNYFTHKKKPS